MGSERHEQGIILLCSFFGASRTGFKAAATKLFKAARYYVDENDDAGFIKERISVVPDCYRIDEEHGRIIIFEVVTTSPPNMDKYLALWQVCDAFEIEMVMFELHTAILDKGGFNAGFFLWDAPWQMEQYLKP
jgi:hypothetical protein